MVLRRVSLEVSDVLDSTEGNFRRMTDRAVESGCVALYLVVKFYWFRPAESKTCLSYNTTELLNQLSGQIRHPDVHRAVKTQAGESTPETR